MKGYKVFEPDWTCKGFQYEVGKTFEENVRPSCCNRGFHFCTDLKDCFSYYRFDPDNKVAEIEAIGDIDAAYNNTKHCTNKIKIVREVTWEEVLKMVNLGKANTGLCNSGDWNSGNRNSGNRNSGDWNSGNRNSGDWNSSDWNSGGWNSGNWNSGDWNSGDCNSGNRNNGDWNSGNRNSGDWNSGDWNSGNRNSGDWNSGDWNSGNRNSGNRNSGDWNSGDCNSGCFNTKTPKIYLFDKASEWTLEDWRRSEACNIMLAFEPIAYFSWVPFDDMTDDEKVVYPQAETTGGYLRMKRNRNQEKWDNLPEESQDIIKALPNFDAKIFKEITGIEV